MSQTCVRCEAPVQAGHRVCRSCGAVLPEPGIVAGVVGAGAGGGPSAPAPDLDRTIDRAALRRLATAVDATAGAAEPLADASLPPGQYGTVPPGPPTAAPPGQYGTVPPGQYGTVPPGQNGTVPPGQYGVVSPLDAGLPVGSGPGPAAPGGWARNNVPTPPGGGPSWRALAFSVDRSWSARWARGVRMVQLSLRLMREQPGLLWVPVCTTATIAAIYVAALVLMVMMPGMLAIVVLAAAFVALGAAVVTGQAVIMHRVAAFADGVTESNTQALRAVLPRWKTLAAWGAVSLAVMTLLRSIERGRGPLGFVLRLLAFALRAAWSAMTFFVIPVILFEGLDVRPAMHRSRQLLRSGWGEGLVGIGVIAVVLNVVGLAAGLLALVLVMANAWILGALVVLVAIIGVNLVAAVATPVFCVVLYRFVTTGATAFELQPEDLAAAFRPRRGVTLAGTAA